ALTGRLPFPGDSLEVMVAKQWFDPPPPREVDPAVPPELDSLCRALMKRDPAERPSGREARRRLAGPGHDDSTGRFRRMALGRGPFVGRREELRLLRRAYERVRAGSAASVYVTGRSGLGKSALVRRFLEDLSRADPPPVVLSGRCLPQESVPFKAVDGLVDALATFLAGLPRAERRSLIPGGFLALSRLFPVLGDLPDVEETGKDVLHIPDAHELRRRAFGALRGLLARLAVDRPVILFVDDLQWGDADSALLFGDVLQAPCPPGLLVVTAYRSEERETNPLLLALRASLATPDTTEITLNELNEEEAADLVTLLADETGPVSRRILTELARDAAGNPLFLQELVRDARRRAGEGHSRPLQEVLLARVEGLGEEARTYLRAVAVSGAPVPAAVAREAARLADEDSAVTVLLNERFVRTRSRAGESEIEPFHEKIREAALSGLSQAEKRILHGRLARAFAARPEPDAERLLHHFHEAEEPAEAAVWAERAAEKASQTLAFERAAQLFREARELFEREGTVRRDLIVKLGESLAAAGRGPDAARAFLEAAETASPEEA
ncbi:MAG TPA: AAA family ATPase, partial [Thermoanaerobaculia bacterium]|nr:AAA family ATPase [Thermoanaerobaculia bacterium]